MHFHRRLLSLVMLGLVSSGYVWSQNEAKPLPIGQLGGGILDQLEGPAGASREKQLKLTGSYTVGKGTRRGEITIRAELQPGWHIYSTTQKPGGPMASELKAIPAGEPPAFQVTRPFVPDHAPHVKQEEFFPVPSEQFDNEVVWRAPFEFAEGADPEKLPIVVTYSGQVCEDEGSCIPINNQKIEVQFAGQVDPPAVGEYVTRRAHATLTGQLSPRTVNPGDSLRVTLTATPSDGYHIYAYADRDPKRISKPTLIGWKNLPEWTKSPVTASQPPEEHQTDLPEEPTQFYHEQPVTWSSELKIPADAAPGGYEVRGIIGYQTCDARGCDLPTAAEFVGIVEVVKQPVASDAGEPLVFTAASYNEAAKLAAGSSPTPGEASAAVSSESNQGTRSTTGDDKAAAAPAGSFALDTLKPVGAVDKAKSMWIVLPTAFLAGFILNFMPCVLPVIGLKIVSFVQQAGQQRSRVLALNIWYSLGLISVFLVLATLAVFAGFKWGDQFQSATFQIVLACVVFAFALSFLGVWEIPLPGFVGSSEVNAVADQEGPSGAFAKGVLTTVLATPCGGPMLVPALTWAVAQPAIVTYTGFAAVGLGMAFPYLVIGAFPRLISFLPKPGNWMETFKHIMGFVLMGTVVFILTFVRISLVVPTVSLMMGLWAGLWWVGRVPVWEDLQKRIVAWAGGAAFVAVIGLVSFSWLDDVMEHRFQREVDQAVSQRMTNVSAPVARSAAAERGTELAWQPYTLDVLSRLISNRRTVFVDFTADW